MFDFRKCSAPRRRALFGHLNCQVKSGPRPLSQSLKTLLRIFSTPRRALCSQPPKVAKERQFLMILTCDGVPRHNGVHRRQCVTLLSVPRHNRMRFFDISTSQSGPFDLRTRSTPQRRALFQHSELPKVLRERCFLCILFFL